MTRLAIPRRRLIQGAAAAVLLPSIGAFAQAPARTLRIGNQKGILSLLKVEKVVPIAQDLEAGRLLQIQQADAAV